jgi:hypothetical protein
MDTVVIQDVAKQFGDTRAAGTRDLRRLMLQHETEKESVVP